MEPLTPIFLAGFLLWVLIHLLVVVPNKMRAQEEEYIFLQNKKKTFLQENVFFQELLPEGECEELFLKLVYVCSAECVRCTRPWVKARETLSLRMRLEQGHVAELATATETRYTVWVRFRAREEYFSYYPIAIREKIFLRFRWWTFEEDLACCRKARLYIGVQHEPT